MTRRSDYSINRGATGWRTLIFKRRWSASWRSSESSGLSFHFTGGVAASFYGDPRFTQDLDLVIELTVDQPETKALLEPPFFGISHP